FTLGVSPQNVRFGSKADIALSPADVRFTPKSGHRNWPRSPSTTRRARTRKTRRARTRKVTPTLPTGCLPVDGAGDRISAGNFLLTLRAVIRPYRARNVRFTPESRHWNSVVKCPLCAKSGHRLAIRLPGRRAAGDAQARQGRPPGRLSD